MTESKHSMITRSQKNINENENNNIPPSQDGDIEIDENGNLKDFIDYQCEEDFDQEMFQNVLSNLRGGNRDPILFQKKKPKKKLKKRPKKNQNISDIFLSYMLLNMLNTNLNSKKYKRKKPLIENNFFEGLISEEGENLEELIYTEEESTDGEEEGEEDLDDDVEDVEESHEDSDEDSDEEDDQEDDEESDEDIEMDEFDEEYVDMVEEELDNEDLDFNYFQNLEKDVKKQHLDSLKEIKEIRNTDVPLKFKILNSDMDLKTKSIAIGNIEKLDEMDISTGEHCKMDKWIKPKHNEEKQHRYYQFQQLIFKEIETFMWW